MAAFGAQHPVFAPFAKPETAAAMPTYAPGVVLGELVQGNFTPTNASGEAFGDDRKIEALEEFVEGKLPLETLDMTDEVASTVYGSTIVDGELVDSVLDEPPYGGLGYFKSLMRAGKKYYRCYWYPKAKAALGADNAQTKGKNITFQTETTNFTILPPLHDEGQWRFRITFDTTQEAVEWLDKKANITAPATGG